MLYFGKKQGELSQEMTRLYKKLQRMEKRLDKRSKRLAGLQEEWNGYALTFLHLHHGAAFSTIREDVKGMAVK